MLDDAWEDAGSRDEDERRLITVRSSAGWDGPGTLAVGFPEAWEHGSGPGRVSGCARSRCEDRMATPLLSKADATN